MGVGDSHGDMSAKMVGARQEGQPVAMAAAERKVGQLELSLLV
jgi:hypothetical protein